MRDYAWKIKVSDLLRSPGKEDEIAFDKKFVPDMTALSEEGVSGRIIVKALDRYSILLSLENVHADVSDISDISGTPYIRHIENPLYEALFIIPQEEHKNKKRGEESIEYFAISEKDESIDITECVRNALLAVEPLVKKNDEERMLDSGEDVENEYDQYA